MRAVRAAEWLIEECRKCPKGYGMTLDFGVRDCPDIMLVLLHGIRAGLKAKRT